MRTASADFLEAVENGTMMHISADLFTAGGVKTELTEDAFMEDPKFTGGSSPAGSFTVGGCVITSFTFRLNNFGGDFDQFDFGGAYIEPYINNGNDSVKMGRFYFASHRAIGHVIQCVAYDALKLMDQAYFSPTYPITAHDAAEMIAGNHGLTLADDFANSDFVLNTPGAELTERQALSYLAAATGNYAKITGDTLYIGWYDTSSPIEQEVFGEEVEISDTTITGVMFDEYTYGSSDYMIDLSGNPYITSSNAASVLSNVGANIIGTTFRPGAVTILSNPALEGGDCITFDTSTEEGVVTIITQYSYRLGVTEDISCDAETEDETDLRTSVTQTGLSYLQAALEHLKNSQVLFSTTSEYDSANDTTTITAHLYADGEEVTNNYPATWFEWSRVTESGIVSLGTGYSITVSNADYLYGGVVRTVFNTIHEQNLVISGGNLVISGGNLVIA